MSIANWNFREAPPMGVRERGGGTLTSGSGYSAFMRLGSKVNGQIVGWLYNGPSFAGNFPLRDGSISGAFRTGTTGNLYDLYGVWIRQQSATPTLATHLNCYFAGLFQAATTGSVGPFNVRLYRVLSGVFAQVGSTWTIPKLNGDSPGLCQFEIRAKNVSSNVLLEQRYNNGTALSSPGSAGWTSWATVATDSGHGGVTNQPGYWGFGVAHAGVGGSSPDFTNCYVYFDQVRINMGID
jgi:hypothetical protein